MNTLLALALGGALGGACRYLVTQVLDRRLGSAFPWGTLAVNTSGAFIAGLVAGSMALENNGGITALFLLAGFCGSYTTVSSWSLQTLALARRGYYPRAIANLLATTLLGLVAVTGGFQLARALEGLL